MRSAAKWVLVLLLVMLGESAHAADKRADRQMELSAREAFAAGRFDQALDLFAKLYADTLHPVYLRNIGRCHQKMRQPDKAIDAFHDYLAKARKLQAEDRKEVEGYIKEMEALRDEQARQARDEKPMPTPTPPPPAHQPDIAVAPPPQPTKTEVSLVMTAPPPNADEGSPFYTRWWFWTAVGVVVAGAVATTLVLTSKTTTRPDCPTTLAGGCQ